MQSVGGKIAVGCVFDTAANGKSVVGYGIIKRKAQSAIFAGQIVAKAHGKFAFVRVDQKLKSAVAVMAEGNFCAVKIGIVQSAARQQFVIDHKESTLICLKYKATGERTPHGFPAALLH